MITSTITLPYCWVCAARFNDVVPNPGTAMREEHHVIPRAAGGEDGPIVSLCETHHQMLHKVSNTAIERMYFHPLIQQLPTREQKDKVVHLATVARNAFQLTKNDPNKKRKTMVNLDPKLAMMLDDLGKVYKQGNEALFKRAIAELHKKHFLKNR